MSGAEQESLPTEIASAAFSGRHLLVVEDDPGLRAAIAAALGERDARVATCARGDEALRRVSEGSSPKWDAIVCDLRLPGADGRAILRAARARDAKVAVLMMTAYGGVDAAVECMRDGAADFLQKPFDLPELELRLARALERRSLLDEVASLRAGRGTALGPESVIAESPAMREAFELARRVAAANSTVLITGETGTGKEVVAGVIHASSPRSARPLVKINCAALPETLLESELFGHERGAFTGADRQRRGRFEEASGGTLFLDEIGEISPATQAKLLRVLQDQEFHRLGGTSPLRTDARIVAATNRDLDQRIREGAFREDLYFRLNVIGLHLPPLRERPEDAVALAERFLEHFCRELARPTRGFTQGALDRIRAHGWPGNVRELRNAVERAVLTGERERIDAADLALADTHLSAVPDPRDAHGLAGLRLELPPEGISLRALERAAIDAALRRSGHVQKDAAQLLGISRRKLNYKIQQLGITHPSWRRNRAG